MRKERIKILHSPTTLETFYCLCHAPTWTETLIGLNKSYELFLIKLRDRNYFQDNKEKTTIKWMSAQLGFEITKVTKWIKLIYEDILELNYYEPEKFQSFGTMHTLHFRHYDNSELLNVWLQHTPRVFERFECYFMKAKVGTDYFWVSEVNHEIHNGTQTIHLTLKGGFCNLYREQLLSRALFERTLGFRDQYEKYDFEIDEVLLNHYRR